MPIQDSESLSRPGRARLNALHLAVTPSSIHVGLWAAVTVLYGLGWSNLLVRRDPLTLVLVFLLVTSPFVIGDAFARLVPMPTVRIRLGDHHLRLVFALACAWAAFSIFELYLYGGAPLLWILQRDTSRNYFDFGIPTAHGLFNGVMFGLALVSIDYFVSTGRRRWLIFHLFFYCWGAVSVSRQNLVVLFISAAFLLMLRGGRQSKILLTAGAAGNVFLFGLIGNLRTGSDIFLKVSQIKDGLPEAVPSSILWIYMYLVMPFNNLLYNVLDRLREPLLANGIGFLAPMMPSVIRRRFLEAIEWNPDLLPFEFTGYLLVQNYNVSTGFIGGAIDFGLVGVGLAALVYGIGSGLLWRNAQHSYVRAVVLTMVVLNAFAPSFTSLPLVAFLLFSYVLDEVRQADIARRRASRLHSHG